MEKLRLTFRVDPDYLKRNTEVKDAVRIKFSPDEVAKLGMLGASGKRMALAGAVFEFERLQAELFIAQKVAIRIDDDDDILASRDVQQQVLDELDRK